MSKQFSVFSFHSAFNTVLWTRRLYSN